MAMPPVEGSTASSLMADSAKQASAPAIITAGGTNDHKRTADTWPEGTNKKNNALCGDFQNDACGPCARGTVICPRDSSKRHQCVLCNGNHPACRCDGSGWQRPGGKPPGKSPGLLVLRRRALVERQAGERKRKGQKQWRQERTMWWKGQVAECRWMELWLVGPGLVTAR